MAWKQRLYAFLLQRVLGPVLSEESKRTLYDSIELSFEEGRFMLQDVDLDPSYLSEKLGSHGIMVEKAFVKKLCIHLSIRTTSNIYDNESKGDKADYNEYANSGYSKLSTMKKLFQLRNHQHNSMALFAEIELDGIEVFVSTSSSKESSYNKEFRSSGSDNYGPSTNHDLENNLDNGSATGGYFSSLVESALASLRLFVSLENVELRFFEPKKDRTSITDEIKASACSNRSWLGMSIDSVIYRDLTPTTVKTKTSNKRKVFQKLVELSGIILRLKDCNSHEKNISTILETNGTHKIQLQAFTEEAETGLTNHSNVSRNNVEEKRETLDTILTNDFQISLSDRINLQLNIQRIQCIHSLLQSIKEEHTSLSLNNNASVKPLDTSSDENDSNGDCDLKKTTTIPTTSSSSTNAIMKKYAEARHLARTKEEILKGGILLPADDDDDDDMEDLDMFFDCNENSFSQYLSHVQSSQSDCSTKIGNSVPSDQMETFYATIHFHLEEICMKFYLDDFSKKKNHINSMLPSSQRGKNKDSITILCNDLDINATRSKSTENATIQVCHFEISDQLYPSETNKYLDSGYLVRFPEENDKNASIIIHNPPCISVSITKIKNNTENCNQGKFDLGEIPSHLEVAIDIIIQPIEISYRTIALHLLKNSYQSLALISDGKIDNPTQSPPISASSNDDSMKIQVSFLCPELCIFVPLNPKKIAAKDFEALLDRRGHHIEQAFYHDEPMLGITIVSFSGEYTMTKQRYGQENSLCSITCEHCTLFVAFPSTESFEESHSWPSKIFEILSFSSDSTISNDSIIKISLNDGNSRTCTTKNQYTNHPMKSSFPLVPPLSSVKARQEVSFDQALRGTDPQGIMLQDAEICNYNISIEIPILVVDLTLIEGQMISKLGTSLDISLGDDKEKECNSHRKKQKEKTKSKKSNAHLRYQIGVGVEIEQISISIHGKKKGKEAERSCQGFTLFLVGDNVKTHVVMGDEGIRNARFLTQNLTLYEASKSRQTSQHKPPLFMRHGKKIRSRGLSSLINVAPIFYRSNLAYPLSPETPALLFDAVKSKDDDYPDDTVIHFSVYDMTFRHDLDSEWIERLFWIVEGIKGSKEDVKDQKSIIESKEDKNEAILKLFVTFSDNVLDYSPMENFHTKSRVMVRLGEIRLSCNLIPDAPIQAYKVSIADIVIHVCNHRYPYNLENERLSCSRQIMDFKDIDTSLIPDNMNHLRFSSVEEVLNQMGFISVANLDSADALIRKVTNSSRIEIHHNVAQSDTDISLTMGQLSIYSCKDAFTCLTETLSEYILEINALSEEEIACLTASAHPTFNIDEGDNFSLDSRERIDSESKEGLSGCITLLDVIEDDMFHEKPLDTVENHLYPFAPNPKPSQKEEAIPYADIPDSELSATELRQKHGLLKVNQSISNITESLLIKNFYTINSSSGISDHDKISQANSNSSRQQRMSSHLEEAMNSDGRLGDEDWTTVDFLYSESKVSDQHAKWLIDKNESDLNTKTPEIKIFPQHVPISRIDEDPIFAKTLDAAKYAGIKKEPRVKVRLIVKDFNLNCRFFDGNDWINPPSSSTTSHKYKASSSTTSKVTKDIELPNRRQVLMEELLSNDFIEVEGKCFDQFLLNERSQTKKGRQMNRYFQFSFQGIKLRLDTFLESKDHLLASCMRLKVNDFSLIETISDGRPIKMLGEWINESEHPRDSNDGVIMLKMVSMRPTCKVSVDGKIMSDESVVKLDLLPLRCYIDQMALRFIKGFLSSSNNESEDILDETEGFREEENDIQVIGTFFKAFNVTSTKLKVNYNPIGVDMGALKEGSYSELLNLFPLEGMELFLQPVQIPNLIGWGACLGEMSSRWIEDIAASQIHKFIAGATPFHSLTNLGEGVADLVLIPVHQYKQGGRKHMGRAVRQGTSKLAGTVAVEALENTSKLTKHLAVGLTELAPRSTASTNVSNGSSGMNFLPSRPDKSPRNISDTIEHAYESLSKGIRAANYTILVVPKREYHTNGTTGAVKSVVKAIPVAVLAPLSGASEAVSYSLLGIRNQLRPDLRKEEEESRRGI